MWTVFVTKMGYQGMYVCIKWYLGHMKQVYGKKISKFQLFVHIFQTWFSLGTGPWGQKFLVQWPPFFLKISYIPNNTIFGHIFFTAYEGWNRYHCVELKKCGILIYNMSYRKFFKAEKSGKNAFCSRTPPHAAHARRKRR